MAKGQKQVCDIRAGKRMTTAMSNEQLRIGDGSAWKANVSGTLDPTRSHLNFEVGPGGVVSDVDKSRSVGKRIKNILKERGVKDPNEGLSDKELQKDGIGHRTMANIILQGSRDTMREMAFGNQTVDYEHGADNSHVTRNEKIEQWAVDMYRFMAAKYGEQNIAAFIVHLDETNPHIHCTVLPITEQQKFSWKQVFAGGDKYEYSKRMKELHDELAEVNRKYGLERGESVLKTGAQHKSYVQWLREVIKEQENMKGDNEKLLSEQKKRLYEINAEVKKAETRLKGLNTMLSNDEKRRENILLEIYELEEQAKKGEITNDELLIKTLKLKNDLAEIEDKIDDRRKKLRIAQDQLMEVAKAKRQLQDNCDEIQRKIDKDLPELLDRTQRDFDALAWNMAAEEAQEKYAELNEYARSLTPEQRKVFNEVSDIMFDGSIFDELAQRANEITAVAAALFLGFVDQATQYAQSSGGGGGPGGGWGRKEDEDDMAYRRRCFIMGRMMMRPAGRKLKR